MFRFFVDENYREKISSGNYFFSHVFSDDVFHIVFDSVLLKDSVQISRYFNNFTLTTNDR